MKTRIAKEAIVRLKNRIGVLAQVSKGVADKGINIEAVIATVDGADAVIRLVTADHQRTIDALRAQKLEVQEAKVVLATGAHKPGLLRHITEKLAQENIDLLYLYATATEANYCLVVFSTTNNDRAVIVLND